MRRRHVVYVALVIVAAAAGSLASCGGDDGGGGGATTTVNVTLREFSVTPDRSSAPAGHVKFDVSNIGEDMPPRMRH